MGKITNGIKKYPELYINAIQYGYVDIDARIKAHNFVKSFLNCSDFSISPNNIIPKNVFMYWGQGWENAPSLVNACKRQALKMGEGFSFHIIDDNNI